jgi:purine-nucleoside phosphorylase
MMTDSLEHPEIHDDVVVSSEGSGVQTGRIQAGQIQAGQIQAGRIQTGGLSSERTTAAMVEWISERVGIRPRIGLILGSGLGHLGSRIEDAQAFSYRDIPYWPISTAIGHAGNLIFGRLAEVPVVALQGRIHLYEGYGWDEVGRPVDVLARLGIEGLVVSNAAGGLNPLYRCGDLMLIDGHLNLMFHAGHPRRERKETASWARRQSSQRPPYREAWVQQWATLARRHNVVLHRGVYAGVSGPNYETRAEYRAFRRLGADAVGMSTIPEVCAAAAHDLPVLGVSVITNEARPDAPTINDADHVIVQAQAAEVRLQRLLQDWLAGLDE